MAVPAPLRALSLCTALLLAVACSPAATSDAPAEAEADATPTASVAATPTDSPAAAATVSDNLTDGCVSDFAPGTDYFPDKVSFDDATGVSVTYAETYKVVEITPPAGGEPLRYVLAQCGTPAPQLAGDLAGAQVIEVPVDEVITLTTANLPHFEELSASDRLAGVGTAAFVSTPSVRQRIEAGEIGEFATAEGLPETESIIGAAPGLLILDAFGEAVLEDAGRLVDAGVPTVLNADFNEQQLLGRAEWLKYTALFLNAEDTAEDAYDRISGAYADVAELASEASERPTVFVNTPIEGVWYMPGGGSYIANAIADAGGEYVFADDDRSTFARELDFETVLAEAGDAEVWLQAGSVNGSLADLLAIDERFDEFAAFRAGEVWAYDRQTTPGGGNAVFETAYTRADLFLSDLVKILHPDLLPDHQLVFFGKVPEGSDPGQAGG